MTLTSLLEVSPPGRPSTPPYRTSTATSSRAEVRGGGACSRRLGQPEEASGPAHGDAAIALGSVFGLDFGTPSSVGVLLYDNGVGSRFSVGLPLKSPWLEVHGPWARPCGLVSLPQRGKKTEILSQDFVPGTHRRCHSLARLPCSGLRTQREEAPS